MTFSSSQSEAVLAAYSILVVEDSPTQAQALRVLLEAHGASVVVAKSAEDAIARLQLAAQSAVASADASTNTSADASADVARNHAVTNHDITKHDVAKPRHHIPDLVLSDVIMPGMSGFELCRTIKGNPALARLPVVLLTSLTDPMDVIRGLESGADNYITKPYDGIRLVERLLQVFRNRKVRRGYTDSEGVEITFFGQQFNVTSSKEHILDFLVSSFEDLVRINDALRASETERIQLYEREREARMEAEAANQAKSEFLASMSHDLRTPLNAIGGYAALMMEEVQGPVTEGQRKYLERVVSNQKHLLALVTDILNFARVERGQVSVEMTDLPVNALLSGARAMIEPQVLAKELTYRVETCDETLLVAADRERTDQIIMNLLANAVKFTPRGGKIEISCTAAKDFVTIAVRDTGVGIPEDRLESIFDPFVQVDSSRANEQQGVGLGLAISQNLARLMGGELTVESMLGKGSTFSLRLQRALHTQTSPE